MGSNLQKNHGETSINKKNHKRSMQNSMSFTSIIILTFNQMKYTQLCIDSIRRYTPPGTYEIIIVDNHSTDGTVDWLREQSDIKLLLNAHNAGFPKGCNQGIKLAKGNDIWRLPQPN